MAEQWEARSALRWGSKSEGIFSTEEGATAFAKSKIEWAGSVGKITHIERKNGGGTIYFTEYEDET